jgi:hypothetical protein
MGGLRPTPMKVLKDKDGFFVHRSILGTNTEYNNSLKSHKDIKKYTFVRSPN